MEFRKCFTQVIATLNRLNGAVLVNTVSIVTNLAHCLIETLQSVNVDSFGNDVLV